MRTPIEGPRYREEASSKLHKEQQQEHYEAEILIENIDISSETLDRYLRGQDSVQFVVRTRGIRKGESYDPELDVVFRKIIEHEKPPEDCNLIVIIRKDNKPARYSDNFHTDAETIYLWSNKATTEVLRDTTGRYREEVSGFSGYLRIQPDEEDIWSPPSNALTRIPADTIHRRPQKALSEKDRYSVRISFSTATT